MSGSEEDTFKRLKRTPYEIAAKEFSHIVLTTGLYPERYKQFLDEHGWTFEDWKYEVFTKGPFIVNL